MGASRAGDAPMSYTSGIGDAILFQRADGIEAGWRVVHQPQMQQASSRVLENRAIQLFRGVPLSSPIS
jgi:hypothetical protein